MVRVRSGPASRRRASSRVSQTLCRTRSCGTPGTSFTKGEGEPLFRRHQQWTIGETFRFVKRSYNLEDIRLLKYPRLKNLIVLVAAASFAVTYLRQQMKLRILIEKLLVISQRFFGIPPFPFYALADGIRRLLSGSAFGHNQILPRMHNWNRLLFGQSEELWGKFRVNRT